MTRTSSRSNQGTLIWVCRFSSAPRSSRGYFETLSEDELVSLRREAETELAEPGRWGTTFTLIQSWGMLEA